MWLVPKALAAVALLDLTFADKRQVLVLRHCVRSTDTDDEVAGYASAPLPRWGVPQAWCTERGLELISETGAALLKQLNIDTSRLSLTSDTIMRTGDTAFALARGMGLHHGHVDFSDEVFSALHGGHTKCKGPKKSLTVEERLARFASVPLPWNFSAALEEVQALIGVGQRGPIAAQGGLAHDDEGVPVGSVKLLRDFAQMIFYTNTSGIPFVHATQDQLYRLLAWQHWYRSVKDVSTEYAIDNAHLLHRILSDLASGGPGSSIYTGHDGNMDGLAAIFNWTWEAPPYMGGALLPTPPGSGLLFEYDLGSGAIEVSYVYHAFNEPGDFKLSQSKVATMSSFEQLLALAVEGLKSRDGAYECFQQAPAGIGAICQHLSDCTAMAGLCCNGGGQAACCHSLMQV